MNAGISRGLDKQASDSRDEAGEASGNQANQGAQEGCKNVDHDRSSLLVAPWGTVGVVFGAVT